MEGWKRVTAEEFKLLPNFAGGAHGASDELAGASVDICLDELGDGFRRAKSAEFLEWDVWPLGEDVLAGNFDGLFRAGSDIEA